jgi:hypothetical protein
MIVSNDREVSTDIASSVDFTFAEDASHGFSLQLSKCQRFIALFSPILPQ